MKQNIVQAARFLAERLSVYKNTNSIVVAMSSNGIEVGYHVAKFLQLPLDILLTATIKHPSSKGKVIGAVCANEVVINPQCHDLPQDFIYHQVALHQHALKAKHTAYKDNAKSLALKGKNIILVSDLIVHGEAALACLKSITRQQPEKIIVAIPEISYEARQDISPVVDDLIFLSVASDTANPRKELSDDEIKSFLANVAPVPMH